MLENVPRTDVEDLSMVYRLQLGKDEQGTATVLVTNDMLEHYGVSKEELHADALESSERNRPAFIKTMQAVMVETLGMPKDMMPPDEVLPIYVVSNEDWLQGAAAAFYSDVMDMAAKELKGDYYVLPCMKFC